MRKSVKRSTVGCPLEEIAIARASLNQTLVPQTPRPRLSKKLSSLDLTSQMQELRIKARNFVSRNKIINDPQTTFVLANLIKEEFREAQSCTVSPQKINCKQKTKICQDRRSVRELAVWLDQKLHIYRNKENLELSDMMEYKQGVMNIGMNELIRMVRCHCSQQAQLINKLWVSTFQIFENIVKMLSNHIELQSAQHAEESNQATSIFLSNLNQLKEQNNQIKNQNEQLQISMKKIIKYNRELKKQKKRLIIKNRLNEYSLQSYQESYQTLLQMTLQSSNNNIVEWSRKIMSKLLRDKRRKRKNFNKREANKKVYEVSTNIVMNWLGRFDNDYKPEDFQRMSLQQSKSFQEQIKKEFEEVRKQSNRHSKTESNRVSEITNQQEESETEHETSEQPVKQEPLKTLDESDEQITDEKIYEYFKCYDVATSTEVMFEHTATQYCPQPTLVEQPPDDIIAFHQAACSQPQNIYQPTQKTKNKTIKNLQNQHKQSVSAASNIVVNNNESSFGGSNNSSAESLSSMSHSSQQISQSNKIQLVKIGQLSSTSRRNFVLTTYDSTSQHGKKFGRRMALLNNHRHDIFQQKQTFQDEKGENRIVRQLELKKFEQIFQKQKIKMIKNIKEYVSSINRRRSFYKKKQQSSNEGDEVVGFNLNIKIHNHYKWHLNNFGTVSKYFRQLYEPNINVIRHKTYKQNLQIFNSIKAQINIGKVRDQKLQHVYNSLSKVLSSILTDYIKSIKKEESMPVATDFKIQKFFYPLNILYVDRFIHTYGLKEIAEKNMKNSLSHILGIANNIQKIGLFKVLLDDKSTGDELQLYVRCLVLLDTTGKVSINQMKDFNIDRLSTNIDMVRAQIQRICQKSFVSSAEITLVLDELAKSVAKSPDGTLTIESVAFKLINASRDYRSSLSAEYLPLYNYLAAQGDFICSFIQLCRLCRIPRQNQTQILKTLISNLDVLEDGNRTISQHRFLSVCLFVSFPTISQMTAYFKIQVERYELAPLIKHMITDGNNLEVVHHLAEEYRVSLPLQLLTELKNSGMSHTDSVKLHDFWRYLALYYVLNSHTQNIIQKMIPTLMLIGNESYIVYAQGQRDNCS